MNDEIEAPSTVQATELTEWGTRAPVTPIIYNRLNRNGKVGPVRGRPISKKLDAALHYHKLHGMPVSEAAVKAGMTRQGLAYALKQPHVISRCKELWADFLSAQAVKSVTRVTQLRDQDENKTVALDASRYLASLAGISPPEKGRFSANNSGARLVTMVLNKRDGTGVRVTNDGEDTTVEVVTGHDASDSERNE